MRLIKTLLFITHTMILLGCAAQKYQPYPLAQIEPTAYQGKFQAAAHWDTLAAAEALEIANTVNKSPSVSFDGQALHSEFSRAYRALLTGHLLDNGVKVLRHGGDYIVSFDVQIISHQGRDALALDPFKSQEEGLISDTEVLVSTHLSQGGELVQFNTRIYYFNPGDEVIYRLPTQASPSRMFQITDQS